MTGQRDERGTECDLDDAGRDHDEVLVDGEPLGHLCPELTALGGEVADTGADQGAAQQPSEHRTNADAIES